MQVSFGSVSAPVKKISREQLLKINVSKILGGPQGHPYTGRNILSGVSHDNSLLGKLKQTRDLLLDNEPSLSDMTLSGKTSHHDEPENAMYILKSVSSTLKNGLDEIINSLF